MSKITEDRTKRNYITAIEKYNPTHQVSIVLDPSTNSDFDKLVLTNNLANIKKDVARVTDTPVIFWLQNYVLRERDEVTKLKRITTLPVVTMLFQSKPNMSKLCRVIKVRLTNCLSSKIINRRYSHKKKMFRIAAINNNKLNDLSKGFGKSNLRRFAVLNKGKSKP